MWCFGEQQKMEKNGVIETRTERRTVITRDGDNIDHDKVTHSAYFTNFDICNLTIKFTTLDKKYMYTPNSWPEFDVFGRDNVFISD